MDRTSTLIGAALLAVTSTANAQGYFSFGEIPGVDVEPSIEIDLNPVLLGWVSEAAKGADVEEAEALAGITNIRVHVYENIADDIADMQKFVEETSARLEREGWHRAVKVNEDGEQVRIYMKPLAAGASAAPGSIGGLTVMVTDEGSGDEAVFINIAGTIQPEQLGRIAGKIGMNGMFNMVPGAVPPPPPPGSTRQ
jgi:hypothetical protein